MWAPTYVVNCTTPSRTQQTKVHVLISLPFSLELLEMFSTRLRRAARLSSVLSLSSPPSHSSEVYIIELEHACTRIHTYIHTYIHTHRETTQIKHTRNTADHNKLKQACMLAKSSITHSKQQCTRIWGEIVQQAFHLFTQ